jgi:hypothetical protein
LLTGFAAATGFWLVDDYVPDIWELDRQLLPPLDEFRRAVGPVGKPWNRLTRTESDRSRP